MRIKFPEDKNLFNGMILLSGDMEDFDYRPLPPFDEKVLDFLNAVSRELLKAPKAKAYPDVVTFGFYCRKANLIQAKEQYAGKIEDRVGRGLAFHIAPSNVPVNFAYTLISGLLAGNANVVKASSKDFPQTRIICEALNRCLAQDEFVALKPYVKVVMYDRNRQDITEWFSGVANLRIIWGGDSTIAGVRKASQPPRSVELTFADRYSIAVIGADAILAASTDEKKMAALAQDFYNDTYLFDQNACTSPRLIYWLGEEEKIAKAKACFWKAVHENIENRYPVEAVIAVNKMLAVNRTAIAIPGSKLEPDPDNRIVRVDIPTIPENIPDLREAGGFFHEYDDSNLDALIPIVDEKYQTISYFGVDAEEIRKFVIEKGLHGIDKIVPIGHTAEWMLTWDGYDLINMMTRAIVAR